MPKLISEDQNIISSLEFKFLKDQIQYRPEFCWIPYEINLVSANKMISYSSDHKDLGDYVLSLKPVNEVELLINGINDFLNDENKKMFSYEGLEPSFEIVFEKSHAGISSTIWVDAGNVISDHYSWDGFGLRFFTSKEKINIFVTELKNEMQEISQGAS